MSTSPRIYRVIPVGPVVDAADPIPVIVTMEWIQLGPCDVEGLAVAWTKDAVHVEWTWDHERRRDWVDASQVRRPGEPPKPPIPGNDPPRFNTRKTRW